MSFARKEEGGREGQEHFTGDGEHAQPAMVRWPGNPSGNA
jgi:hypothetical protein